MTIFENHKPSTNITKGEEWQRRKEEERLAREGERIGLAGEIKLLPKRAVSEQHSRSLYAAQARPTPSTKKRRREIKKASIFAGAAAYGPGAGGRAKR